VIAPDDLALQLVDSFARSPAEPREDLAPPRAVSPAPLGPETLIGPGPETGPGPDKAPPEAAPPDAASEERHDLLETLTRRSATRVWSQAPLPGPLLADIIGEGVAQDAEDWPGEQAWTPLEITVVAFRVEGMVPAVHRFDARGRTARAVMELPPPERRRTLTLQAEFGDAPAIVSVAVDLHTAEVRDGGHGYRTLLTRAGAAVHTMWLAGVSWGLTGSAFAGFIPASVRAPLRSDGTSRQQVFALALGHPPQAPPSGAPTP
jgi:hypothetical protein